jgi:hypothetical protein
MMMPGNDVRKLLAVLGTCAWMAASCGGGSSAHLRADSGAGPTGGTLGSGGGVRADAMPGTGGDTGGTQAPDAAVGSGGQGGRGTSVGSGGMLGSGGVLGSGGSTGQVDASTWDTGSTVSCGKPGATCGAGQFCDLDSKCGTIAKAEGTCEATGPTVTCTKEYRPVCGCNQIAYDNDCLRRAAGVLKLQDGLCGGAVDGGMGGQPGYDGGLGHGGATGTGGVSGAGGTTGTSSTIAYTGCTWSGGMDHMKIGKRDLAQDQCIELDLARPTTSRPGYTVTLPDRWALVSATIGPCTGSGTAVLATSATGTITLDAVYPPTAADVDLVLGVTLVDGGATVTYVFSVQAVDVSPWC